METMHHAVAKLKSAGVRQYEVYSPVLTHESLEAEMPRRGSWVRPFTWMGGITGVGLGLAMCILSSLLYGIITGGKPPVSPVPFVVVGFECTILFAALFTVASLVVLARLRPLAPPAEYDGRFSNDRYGVYVQCDPERIQAVAALLRSAGATEVKEYEGASA